MTECQKKANDKFTKSKKGLVGRIYDAQRMHSTRRGHRQPEYSKQELKDWLYSQELFHKLYSEWVNSDYKKDLKPSVDRKEDDVHYCMSNIQLMTWERNRQKKADNMKAGIDNRMNKSVYQYTLNDEFVAMYHSQADALRQTGIDRKSIRNCINGKSKQASGYHWKSEEL